MEHGQSDQLRHRVSRNPIACVRNDERTIADLAVDFIPDAVNYLTVISSYGSTSGSGWYKQVRQLRSASLVTTVSCGTGCQYSFISWSGSGTGSYSGSSASASVTMNNAITETANWQLQYYLTVSSSFGSPSGQGWYNVGTSASFGVTTPASCGSGCQYVFTSWSGSGSGSYSGSASSSSVTMNNAITETANWQLQYYLTMSAGAGGTVSPSSEWVNSGSSVTITATPHSGYYFSSWSGTGTGSYSGSSSSQTITVNNAITETDFIHLKSDPHLH